MIDDRVRLILTLFGLPSLVADLAWPGQRSRHFTLLVEPCAIAFLLVRSASMDCCSFERFCVPPNGCVTQQPLWTLRWVAGCGHAVWFSSRFAHLLPALRFCRGARCCRLPVAACRVNITVRAAGLWFVNAATPRALPVSCVLHCTILRTLYCRIRVLLGTCHAPPGVTPLFV
jgi:hypothetical protein